MLSTVTDWLEAFPEFEFGYRCHTRGEEDAPETMEMNGAVRSTSSQSGWDQVVMDPVSSEFKTAA